MLPSTHIQGNVDCAADFIGRDKNITTYGFTAEDVERLIEKMLALIQAGAVFVPQSPSGDAPLSAEHAGERLTFYPDAALRLRHQCSERAYLLGLVIQRDHQIWATKFIPLGARIDMRRAIQGWDIPVAFSEFRIPPPGSGPDAQITTEPLEDITQALACHPAFVILGEPGAGKTTTLQKLAYDAAAARLAGGRGRIPLLVQLSQQGACTPFNFLAAEWQQRTGSDFGNALSAGQVLLLLDGINELPHEERPARLKAWRLFAETYAAGNPCVFTSREKDYQSLNLPRVRIEPLDDPRIADYLTRNQAEGLADLLDDPRARLREMARNPFYLLLLTYAYKCDQRGMANRGRLLQWFVKELFSREERLTHPGWIPPAAQSAALARMAFQMQEQGESTALPRKTALVILPPLVELNGEDLPTPPNDLLRLARAASLLDPNTAPDVRFYHHLLQEYFAAFELLRRFAKHEDLSRLWRAKRTQAEMPASPIGWDALPDPPATGWEVTTLLACGLSPAPAALIEAVRRVNPTLAGRCLVEAGLEPSPSLAPVLAATQKDLLADLYGPQIHLRARLQAGFTLGKIGDPRFPVREIGGGRVIVPEVVAVPGGRYWIGSDENDAEAYEDEKPRHLVDIAPFSMGKWPVTNAEFACFMQAGGYQDERYWQGETAKRWIKRGEVTDGQIKVLLDVWQYLHDHPDWKERFEKSGNYSPKEIETNEHIASLSRDGFKKELSEQLSQKSRTQPYQWDNTQYNTPSQPVIGITWFEARGYCAWLAQVTGRECRLPREIEWEAAARGMDNLRIYPWGDEWEIDKANTLEGRVLKPSPVGVYAAANSVGPFGAEDQSGNVWNWTSSLYSYPYHPLKPETSEAEGERILRGGAWDTNHWSARCADRGKLSPVFFDVNLGFRVIFPGVG